MKYRDAPALLLTPIPRRLLRLLALAATVLCLLAAHTAAQAQSACTAMWATLSTNQFAYFNTSAGRWVTTTAVIAGVNLNALAGSTANNLLYVVDRTTRQLYSYNPNTGALSAAIGTIPAPPAPAAAGNILGATFDLSGRLFVYASEGSPSAFVVTAQVSTANAATLTSWTQMRTTAGATPTLSGSGDMYVDAGNASFIISNTAPPTYHLLDLTPGASFAQTISPPLAISGTGNVQVAGAAVDPATAQLYFGSGSAGSTTYALDAGTGVATLVASTTAYTVSDMGNCPFPPAPPTLSKTFSPTATIGAGTSRAVVTLGNANTNPVWLLTAFKDTLPAGMAMTAAPNLTSSCSSSFGTPTTAGGSSSVTFVAGGRIPAGGCSISFTVSAPAASDPYVNTLAAGALSTTAGSNTLAASASFTAGVDFTLAKSQRKGTSGALQTATLTVGAGQTLQYVLTIVNTSGGAAGSATFTDTLPALVTPVLSVTAVAAGGGACRTATAVVTGRTQVRGTVTALVADATCTVTITARGSATVATASTFANTATLRAIGATADPDSTDNTATVTTTIAPLANLTVAKTNGASQVVAGGTTSYTITVANLGPANAPGTVLADPPVTGLSCATVTCAVTAGTASCPAPLTMAALQGAGLAISPTFNANSTLAFVVTCGVTATGS